MQVVYHVADKYIIYKHFQIKFNFVLDDINTWSYAYLVAINFLQNLYQLSLYKNMNTVTTIDDENTAAHPDSKNHIYKIRISLPSGEAIKHFIDETYTLRDVMKQLFEHRALDNGLSRYYVHFDGDILGWDDNLVKKGVNEESEPLFIERRKTFKLGRKSSYDDDSDSSNDESRVDVDGDGDDDEEEDDNDDSYESATVVSIKFFNVDIPIDESSYVRHILYVLKQQGRLYKGFNYQLKYKGVILDPAQSLIDQGVNNKSVLTVIYNGVERRNNTSGNTRIKRRHSESALTDINNDVEKEDNTINNTQMKRRRTNSVP